MNYLSQIRATEKSVALICMPRQEYVSMTKSSVSSYFLSWCVTRVAGSRIASRILFAEYTAPDLFPNFDEGETDAA